MNTVHSIDGMIVREMLRRCNYDKHQMVQLLDMCTRGVKTKSTSRPKDKLVLRLWELYEKSGFLSARILDELDHENFGLVDRYRIQNLLFSMPHRPFEMISVHDCFKCLPNYGNDLRLQYNKILAEIAGSEMLSFLISQIVGRPIQVTKLDPTLAQDVVSTNYALS
jgi:hypothetical protein